jgi:uncharacterized repeat protein (TIGR03803 family)
VLFGIASSGGQYSSGVVFELSKSGGVWLESVAYPFQGGAGDGSFPVGIKFDATTGDFFGTTQDGGSNGEGTVFELTPSGSSWSESVLHSFGSTSEDGADPPIRPIQDKATNALLGITSYGGRNGGGSVWTIPVTQAKRSRPETNR